MAALTEQQQELLRLCPDCGSPAVDFSVLEGGDASCRACKWSGRKDDLFVLPVTHQLGTSEEVLVRMYNSWRDTFGRFATDVARFLLQWGFLTAKKEGGKLNINPKKLARYVSVAAASSLASILEEREKIEKEQSDGN